MMHAQHSSDRLIGNWGGRIYVEGVRSFDLVGNGDQDVLVYLDTDYSY